MQSLICSIQRSLEPLQHFLGSKLSPVLDLSIRLYMAKIFFVSGWAKLNSALDEDWESTLFLFEEIHPVPGISPQLAAVSGTAAEIVLPVLLVFGLFSRFAATGLLIMTMVIQYAVPEEYGMSNVQHYFWMFMFAVIVTKGPGALSLDALIRRKAGQCV